MSSTLRTDWLTSWWNYNNQQNTNSTSSTSYTTLCMNNNFDPYWQANTLFKNYAYSACTYPLASDAWRYNYSIGAYNTYSSYLGQYTYWRPLGGNYQNGLWVSPYGDYQTPTLSKDAIAVNKPAYSRGRAMFR